jgi:hypothetical protein
MVNSGTCFPENAFIARCMANRGQFQGENERSWALSGAGKEGAGGVEHGQGKRRPLFEMLQVFPDRIFPRMRSKKTKKEPVKPAG